MDDYVSDAILNLIRARMIQYGLNPSALAKKAGLGGSFVYDVLSGKSRNPTVNKLGLVISALGLSLSVKDRRANTLLESFLRVKDRSVRLKRLLLNTPLARMIGKRLASNRLRCYAVTDGRFALVSVDVATVPGTFMISSEGQVILKSIGLGEQMLLDEFYHQGMVVGKVVYMLEKL